EGDLNSRALASNRSRIYRLTGLGHPGLTLDMFALKLIIQAIERTSLNRENISGKYPYCEYKLQKMVVRDNR
ncbi:MAG: hypothetical protein M1341_04525, partial [Candidatus Thermoplasmatota archaeon]|nr:hypothetical protein [Candidatus Thermoplasmatota archaeon]